LKLKKNNILLSATKPQTPRFEGPEAMGGIGATGKERRGEGREEG